MILFVIVCFAAFGLIFTSWAVKSEDVRLLMAIATIILVGIMLSLLSEKRFSLFRNTLIEDGKIEYHSDKYGETELHLIDSTLIKTYELLKEE